MNEKLQDLQNSPADLPLPIDRVGIKDFRLPLLVRDRENGHQHTVAVVDMGVDLPADFKGTHMSRFVEALEHWRAESREELGYASMKRLLEDVLVRLEARKAYIRFKFPYFRTKKAPISSSSAPVSYDCCFSGELERGREKPVFLLQLEVPITTVCPCSKAISEYGAHGQRAVVRLEIKMGKFEWMEEFIDLAEESGSAQIYSLLKRSDEKSVTEQAYEQARFVEDVVRAVADKLGQHPNVGFFKVEVESFESIHAHNAFASIERDLRKN